jgi:chromosome segregation ATPase
MTTANGQTHPALSEHFTGMNDALHERDQLRIELNKTQNDLAIEQGKSKFLQEQIDTLKQERDYYWRKSFAYSNTLASARNQLQNMMTLADHEAENPSPLPPTNTAQLQSFPASYSNPDEGE